MQRKQKNTAWTPVVYAAIRAVSGYEQRNHGATVYRLCAADNATAEATRDANALCPAREYRTMAACKKAAEKLGWTVI